MTHLQDSLCVYKISEIQPDPRGGVRLLITGPGTGAGVSYWLSNATEAATLVENLNLSYSYAAQPRLR